MGPHGERPGPRTGGRKRTTTRTAVIVVASSVAVLVATGIWSATLLPPAPKAAAPSDRIDVFTFVETGIVYVEPDTSRIRWQDGDGVSRNIGRAPWNNPEPDDVAAAELPWGAHREVVGNPDLDLVAWVETIDGERGDLVVVEASSGDVLARTPVDVPVDRSVVIASVDEEAVYFATPDPTWGIPDVPDEAVWIWRWALGEAPQHPELLPGRFHNDVSAGIWAVYENRGMTFRELNGQTRSFAGDFDTLKTDFGGALSPDGRYWYGAGSSQIVDTATGDAVDITVSADRYGWTGPASLTLIRPVLVTCSAVTGACVEPFGAVQGLSPYGVCFRYRLVCGFGLPVN